MQTYTHMAVGGAIGLSIFPHSFVGQALCVFGSILPDLTMVPIFILDKVKKKKKSSLEDKSPWLQTSVEILHSIPVMIVMTIFTPILLPLWIGIWSHIIIDFLTHSGERYYKDDVTHLWPVPVNFKLGHSIGIWEYRMQPGDLRPKLLEAVILSTLVLLNCILFVKIYITG